MKTNTVGWQFPRASAEGCPEPVAALVTLVPLVAAWPVLGVAAGSVAGLVFNFTLSKLWVFQSAAD